ncbi:hypothetical protein AKJ16_DCAP06782 [Drosera capensis]
MVDSCFGELLTHLDSLSPSLLDLHATTEASFCTVSIKERTEPSREGLRFRIRYNIKWTDSPGRLRSWACDQTTADRFTFGAAPRTFVLNFHSP